MRLGDHLFAGVAAQHVRHVQRAEPLSDARNARENLPRQDDWLPRGLELVEAIVAGAAVVGRVAVAEVLREMAVAAADAGGVAFHLTQ